jgi:hypothetical protein
MFENGTVKRSVLNDCEICQFKFSYTLECEKNYLMTQPVRDTDINHRARVSFIPTFEESVNSS